MNATALNRMACAALLLYCAGVIISLSLRLDRLQWDFGVYYHAPQAFARGLNPYRMIVPCAVEGAASPRGFKYYYPPFMLLPFAAFSLLGYTAAARLFFAANVAAAAALLLVWRNGILGGRGGAVFYLFCLAAFGSPIYIALKAGNVAIMEQCALWLAFSFLLARRYAAFCACLFAAAAFKGTPLLFLSLLLFETDGRRYRFLAFSAAAVCAAAAAVCAAAPGLVQQFLAGALRVVDKAHQPSTYAALGEMLPGAWQKASYGAVAAAVLACTVRAAAALRAGSSPGKNREMLFLACAAYAVLLPHFEDYSYIVLIVPAYAVLCGAGGAGRPAAALFFLILSSAGGALPVLGAWTKFALRHSPLTLAYCLWGVSVWRALRGGAAGAGAAAGAGG
jgi:hypothetical protein